MIRLLSGLALAAITLAAILFLPITALRLLACAVAVLATHEYLRVAVPAGAATRWLLAAAVAVVCWRFSQAPLDAAALLLLIFLVVAVEVLFRGRTIQQAGAEAFAPVYIAVPLGMLVSVHARYGAVATLLLIGTVVVSDSAQYYTGRAFGRRPLAPAISPKKTIEGAVGGVVIGSLFMLVAGGAVFPLAAPLWLLAVGILIVVSGICGDLFESRIKRVAGVKDSSTLIPGHGGVLDRIDALLFAAPVFYLAVQRLA
jgi:phosphatidate cytidylyltransferase